MRILILVVLLSMVCISPGIAQPVGAGVKGGWTPTDWTPSVSSRPTNEDRSGHYTAGPYVEVRFPSSFAVEAAALYRPFGTMSTGGIGGYSVSSRLEGRSWEIPVVGKYRFPVKPVTPFALVGVAFRNLGTLHGVGVCSGELCGGGEGTSSITRAGFTTAGVVAGAGVEWKTGPLRLAAEGRYTRYGAPDEAQFGTNRFELNQAAILFSIGF